MFEREERSNVTSSALGFLFISAVGLVIVFLIPYITILHLSNEPVYISTGVGFIVQIVGIVGLFMGVRPVVEVAVHRLGLIRNLFSKSPRSPRELISDYVHHKKTSEPVVVNVEVGEELDRGGTRLYIEFISETRFGVLFAELDDLGDVAVENLSFIDTDDGYSSSRCKLRPMGAETIYSAPIYDSMDETSAGFSRICENCVTTIMADANKKIQEESSEVVMKTI